MMTQEQAASREGLWNDEALVERVVSTGDKGSFEPLVERFRKPVMKLLYRMTGDYEGSLELAQETFLRAWNYLGSYRRDMRFHSWLFKIAHNTAVDYMAKRRRMQDHETALEDTQVDLKKNGWEKSVERGMYVQELLIKLREPYKTAIVLRYMEDLSYEEIAQIMETNVAQVKNHLFRGRIYLLESAREVKHNG